MKSSVIYIASFVNLFLGYATALPAQNANITEAAARPRPPNRAQCGNPDTATTFFEGFKPSATSHAPDDIPDFVTLSSNGDVWNIDPPSFRAWITAGEPNTVPFYYLYNPDTYDYLYLTSDTTTPPSRSGYDGPVLLAYVYSQQMCDSVPLYCVDRPDDHWYTTNLAEHDDFVSQQGWTDCGITAYVLPITNFTQIVA